MRDNDATDILIQLSSVALNTKRATSSMVKARYKATGGLTDNGQVYTYNPCL